MKKNYLIALAGLLTATCGFSQIQNQYTSAQTADMWITGRIRTTGTGAEIILQKDGSNNVNAAFHLRNAGFDKGVNFQLTGETLPGLATWIWGGTTWKECMRLMPSGYLGLGTTAPLGMLHLNGTGPTMYLTTPDPTATSSAAAFRGNNGTWLFGYSGASGAEDVSIGTRDGTGTRTLILAAGGAERMRLLANGNVGIGTSVPAYKLDVSGTAYVSGSTISAGQITAINGTRVKATSGNGVQVTGAAVVAMRGVGTNTTTGYASIQTAYDNVNFSCPLTLQEEGGNVLIGKTTQTNTNYKLDVNGNVRANKLVVNTTGADFVFEKGYQLPTLDSVEKHINQYHHLPAIAPAADMQKEGVDVGEHQTKLLQKIEELTLYIIEQNKQLTAQGKQLQEQGEEIKQLKKKVR